jgi:glycosyltransferase involved in cell wall biosynthesis
MDHAQMGLALGLRFPFPVRISGILFHPTLHYPAARSFNPKAHLQRLRKRWLLQLVARNRHLDTVFTLDASAVPSLKALGLRAVALADPVGPGNVDARTPQEMKRLHGIDPDRKVLLLFGALTARKGVVPMLKSVAMLPPWAARQVALLMAGPLDPALRPQVSLLSSGARAAGVQVVHHDAYIQSGSAQPFMEAADLVLAPYQRHFGSSAVLVRAARAQRPVLSQEFGLMGANVRDYGLGQCVDTADPGAIAAGIETFLNEPGSGYDRQRSAGFVQANTPDRFCRTLLSHLLPPESSL